MIQIAKYGNTGSRNFQFVQCENCGCEFHSNEFVLIDDVVTTICPDCNSQIQLESESITDRTVDWISVKDELPETKASCGGFSDDVLLVFESTDKDDSVHRSVYAGFYGEGKWHSYMHGSNCVIKESEFERVTHWKSMPKLPDEV